MKKISIFLSILFCVSAFSQKKIKDDYKVLIDSAIVIKANNLYENYNQDLSQNIDTENWNIYINNLKEHVNNIYVTNENFESMNLNDIKTKIPLKSIDVKSPRNKKLLRKKVNIWKVKPLLQGIFFKIDIIDFSAKYKNKKYHFENGGGSTIIFEYSCNEGKWKLINAEHKGN